MTYTKRYINTNQYYRHIYIHNMYIYVSGLDRVFQPPFTY